MPDIAYEKWVALIILLVGILIFINFQGSVKEASAEYAAKEACKVSVKETSAFRLRYEDFSGDIKCQTQNLKIKDAKIAKKKVADAMYDCWDQFGRGKLDLFADDNVYCVICNYINFSENVKISGLNNYLATQKPQNQDTTYLDILTAERTENSKFLKELESRKIYDELDASKKSDYAAVFTYIKGKKYLEEYSKKIGYTQIGIGIAAIGTVVVFKGGPAAAVISSSFLTPAGGVAVGLFVAGTGTILFGVGALWSYIAWNYAGVPFEHIASVSFIPYDAQELQALNCKDLPVKQKQY